MEIGSSLISAKNSGRRFQTHVSNSGEQIPKHSRQNSDESRFPVSRNKVRSRGHRFLGTDFSILVSEFKFLPRSRIWEASHFSFLDSRCKSKDAHGLEIAQFQFLISRFTILVSKRPLHIPNPPVPHFSFLVSGFKGALLSRDLRRAHFSIPISQFSLHRLQRIERRYKTRILSGRRIRLQIEMRIIHYSAPHCDPLGSHRADATVLAGPNAATDDGKGGDNSTGVRAYRAFCARHGRAVLQPVDPNAPRCGSSSPRSSGRCALSPS